MQKIGLLILFLSLGMGRVVRAHYDGRPTPPAKPVEESTDGAEDSENAKTQNGPTDQSTQKPSVALDGLKGLLGKTGQNPQNNLTPENLGDIANRISDFQKELRELSEKDPNDPRIEQYKAELEDLLTELRQQFSNTSLILSQDEGAKNLERALLTAADIFEGKPLAEELRAGVEFWNGIRPLIKEYEKADPQKRAEIEATLIVSLAELRNKTNSNGDSLFDSKTLARYEKKIDDYLKSMARASELPSKTFSSASSAKPTQGDLSQRLAELEQLRPHLTEGTYQATRAKLQDMIDTVSRPSQITLEPQTGNTPQSNAPAGTASNNQDPQGTDQSSQASNTTPKRSSSSPIAAMSHASQSPEPGFSRDPLTAKLGTERESYGSSSRGDLSLGTKSPSLSSGTQSTNEGQGNLAATLFPSKSNGSGDGKSGTEQQTTKPTNSAPVYNFFVNSPSGNQAGGAQGASNSASTNGASSTTGNTGSGGLGTQGAFSQGNSSAAKVASTTPAAKVSSNPTTQPSPSVVDNSSSLDPANLDGNIANQNKKKKASQKLAMEDGLMANSLQPKAISDDQSVPSKKQSVAKNEFSFELPKYDVFKALESFPTLPKKQRSQYDGLAEFRDSVTGKENSGLRGFMNRKKELPNGGANPGKNLSKSEPQRALASSVDANDSNLSSTMKKIGDSARGFIKKIAKFFGFT